MLIEEHIQYKMDTPKISLVFCELHNKKIHGFVKESTPDIQFHYLVIEKIKVSDFDDTNLCEDADADADANADDEYDVNYDDDDTTMDLNDYCKSRKHMYSLLPKSVRHSDQIRNYDFIMCHETTSSPQIAQCITLSGKECVAIIKTFWIRWIQRRWKNVYKERMRVINKRQAYTSLIYRERHGNWPIACARMPTLNGMLRTFNIKYKTL